jgi:uncharacterized protein
MTENPDILRLLTRIADALDRQAPPRVQPPDLRGGAFVWNADAGALTAAPRVGALPLNLLRGVDRQRETLLANTQRFAAGLPANNALLWGARGMGKSALVKAVWRHVADQTQALALIEIHAGDLGRIETLMRVMTGAPVRAIVFCDDLAFAQGDPGYRAAKALLEGGVIGRPDNIVFYATSNRRHLLARDMSENERSTPIHPSEDVEEHVSLSDRFGLWLGFHPCTQDVYLEIVAGYAAALNLGIPAAELRTRAIAWAAGRSARSGRTAWQFIQDLSGELGVKIPL